MQHLHVMIVLLSILTALPVYADNNSDFLQAAKKGDILGVKAISKAEVDINTADANGMTALMYAAKNGNEDIVSFLIKSGADLNKKNSNEETAIMLSAKAHHQRITQLLFNESATADFYTYFYLGGVYLDDGMYDKAVAFSTQAIEYDSQNDKNYWLRVQSYWIRAQSNYFLKKHDLAISDLKEVNKLAPNFADAYGILGWIYILLGRFDEAKKPSELANELDPVSHFWAINLGHIYLLKGNNEKAKGQYKKSILLIKADEDLISGPIADFELFIKNSWKVKESKVLMAWIKEEWEDVKSKRWKEPNSGMEFVRISPGSFLMGSNTSYEQNEKPVHRVTISKAFYIQTTEVTQGQWKAVMGGELFKNSKCNDDCPAVYVSWYDAQKYIKKLNMLDTVNNYRLPSEAEWEYVCRAGTQSPFYFGERLKSKEANFYNVYASANYLPADGKIVAVASYPPSAWGVYDMHGNVWEWCRDWFGKYTAEYVIDPIGPESGKRKVVRGGGFDSWPDSCSSSSRTSPIPDKRQNNIGFRLVMVPKVGKGKIQKQESQVSEITKPDVKSKFFDKFFFVILALVVVLSSMDWLLGKEGRAKIKGKVEDFWLYLTEISFSGLVSKDAEMAKRWLEKIFGKKILSARCLIFSAVISIITTIVVMGILFSLTGPYGKIIGWKFGVKFIVRYGYKLLVFNALVDYISLAITFYFLTIMVKQIKLWILFVILFCDLLIAYILAISTYFIGTMIGLVGYPYASFSFSLFWSLQELTIFPIIITAILPSLIHSTVAFIFIISKLFRPLFQKPTELILLRLSESDKGILTSVAAGLGVFAKFVQEGFKIFDK